MIVTCRLIWTGALLIEVGLASATSSAFARDIVNFRGGSPGTIVVRTGERQLYFVTAEGQAIRYPVSVTLLGK